MRAAISATTSRRLDPELERLERAIARPMGKAIEDWRLIEEGDRILVGVSGGKDSYTLAHLLRRFQERAPLRFEILAVHLDQGQPGFDSQKVVDYLAAEGFDCRLIRKDTYRVVTEKIEDGETTCSLCSRLRRGILYNAAAELGCNKLALGHHRDDAIETLLLNLFFCGRAAAMPATLTTNDGRFRVIRPLIYAAEEDIRAYAERRRFPIEPCRLCVSTERDQVAAIVAQLAARNPSVRGNLLAAMQNLVPSHLLDRRYSER
jgi:tRNA 2-thiocytidine biosynthesis protein TtcA